MRGPTRGFETGLLHHPFADWHDQPGVLGQRDELARADRAVDIAVPAHQRLETDHLFGVGVDHRLVGERQLVVLERIAQ